MTRSAEHAGKSELAFARIELDGIRAHPFTMASRWRPDSDEGPRHEHVDNDAGLGDERTTILPVAIVSWSRRSFGRRGVPRHASNTAMPLATSVEAASDHRMVAHP